LNTSYFGIAEFILRGCCARDTRRERRFRRGAVACGSVPLWL